MKITVFTSNQARHIALVNRLAEIASQVFAVLEATTFFPGKVSDFYAKSETMKTYFQYVRQAEQALFPLSRFTRPNVSSLTMRSGDLNYVDKETLSDALDSDIYIVFGASYIRGWLVEHLTEHQAVNIHMGLSPYYRGNSCNFWAMYDNRPEYVGATIHLLSKGLDSGPILFHSRPVYEGEDPFTFSMKAVKSAQSDLVRVLGADELFAIEPVLQSRDVQIRYTKNSDFTDNVARDFLDRNILSGDLSSLLRRNIPPVISPLPQGI